MIRQLSLRAVASVAAVLIAVAPAAHACTERSPTRQTGPGPHDFSTAPADPRLWREGDLGEPLSLRLRVLDSCGEPVAGALVRILHADQDGEHHPDRYRAHLSADDRGVVTVTTVYPGHAGYFARHIHFVISHPAHATLVTRLFFKNDASVEGQGVDDLSIVLEELHGDGAKRWVGGFEFVLAPG
jgi:protocatechuate 3,4-dioxygenase beta subunit